MVAVCLPGTGGMLPTENRWLSCCWIEYQGKALLIDCGEGTQIALRKSGCKLSHLDLLLFTHFHADHIAGLPGLLLTLGNSGKRTPLTIAGPMGLKKVVDALSVIAPIVPYPLVINELEEKDKNFEHNGLQFSFLPLKHGIPCFGYSIILKRKPIFNPDKAAALKIPKSSYKTLHEGKTICLEDRRIIRPEMVLDGERQPIKICYFTDTIKLDAMREFAWGADLLISEGMHAEEEQQGLMAQRGHMLFSDSATLAKEAGVKKLWLTHYSPALTNPEQFIDKAQHIFFETAAGFDGIRENF
ncbi:ribonuclease Z [Clostridium aminobutyricum]|uniref:Ribonuclease Z n=2 Tax=Clostridium aminobutyricum TaxID=33953 RepID=A0A939IH59_CLOAM|nr:ribonuclease Z [Clostridium aminobutyricum]